MGIHIPKSLLNVSEAVKVKVKLSRITDRQIKNIVRNIKTGWVPLYGNSATAHLTRHIAKKFDVPCIKWSNWRLQLHDIKEDHPLWDAIPNAAAITKIEANPRHMEWYGREIDHIMENGVNRSPNCAISYHYFSNTGQQMIQAACKKPSIPDNHAVHAYLDKLTNREMEFIELETF